MLCPFCDSTVSTPVRFALFGRSRAVKSLRRCSACRSQFQSPPPPPQELALEYERYFSRRHRGVRGAPAENPKESYAKLLVQHVGSRLAGARVLDLGAGEGFFSEYILRNTQAHFVTAVDQLGVPRLEGDSSGRSAIFRGSVEEFTNSTDQKFEVILALDLLEHLYDPKVVFRCIKRLLAPGGVAIVTSPRVPSFSSVVMGALWFQYKLEHLTYPSFRGIEAAAREQGITILELKKHKKLLPLRYIVSVLSNFGPDYLQKCFAPFRALIEILPSRFSQKTLLLPSGELILVATCSEPAMPRAEM